MEKRYDIADIKKQLENLRNEIRKHNYLYYVLNKPEISDYNYDQLLEKLSHLESLYPELITSDSPTQRVGAPPSQAFDTVRHMKTMLSLDTAKKEEVSSFDIRIKKDLQVTEIEYVAEPKLDGLSVELVYEDGKYISGSTRGNGVEGEDVTENIRTIRAVPLILRHNNQSLPKILALRAEVIMKIEDFETYNKEIMKKGNEPLANPRNAAAGSLRRLDPRETAERPLDIFFYEIMYLESETINIKTQFHALELLKEWGLKVIPQTKLCKNINETLDYHALIEKNRDNLNYEIDGVVIKVNRIDFQKTLGEKTRSPRWAIAYKFPPRQKQTQIVDIVVQVGRTGVLTPSALLKPVNVKGVTVSRATLHNADYIKEKDIRKGDWVKVARAGDVIPEVIEVIKHRRSGNNTKFTMPATCPICDSHVIKQGAYHRCTGGLSCSAQLKRSITHFASKNAMDIDGMGAKTVTLLVDTGLIKRVSDIYRLNEENLLCLPGFAKKSARNLIAAIEESKNQRFSRFVYGLGIPQVGEHTAYLLAERFTNITLLSRSTKEELLVIKDIGPETTDSIINFFSENHNKNEINELKTMGINMEHVRTDNPLRDKIFVFTGSLEAFPRDKAKSIVENLGGTVTNTISKNVDYVVVGSNPGGKYDKALSYGLKIINVAEFKELVGHQSTSNTKYTKKHHSSMKIDEF
jgi:DNA ligase (NAD+)